MGNLVILFMVMAYTSQIRVINQDCGCAQNQPDSGEFHIQFYMRNTQYTALGHYLIMFKWGRNPIKRRFITDQQMGY